MLASFRGGQITVSDMLAAIAVKDPRTRAELATPAGRERFLRELIRYDLLVQEAARRGYAEDPRVIDAAKQATIQVLLERDLAVDPASIPAAEVERAFEAKRSAIERPAMRRASQVLLATEAEARALIAELRGASRERFAEVAGERSLDERTRRQGGELGYFDRDGHDKPGSAVVAPELARAAFALAKVGQIGPRPIRHAQGFSVLMLTGEMAAIKASFAQVEPTIRAELADQRLLQAQQALIAKLREQTPPKVRPELVNAIALDPARPADLPQGFPAAPPDPRAPAKMIEPDGI